VRQHFAGAVRALCQLVHALLGNIKPYDGEMPGKGHGQGKPHVAKTDNRHTGAPGAQIIKTGFQTHDVSFLEVPGPPARWTTRVRADTRSP